MNVEICGWQDDLVESWCINCLSIRCIESCLKRVILSKTETTIIKQNCFKTEVKEIAVEYLLSTNALNQFQKALLRLWYVQAAC